MLLAIDIGNTNTVVGLFDDEKLTHSWRVRTAARATADELALLFRGLLDGVPITGISAQGQATCQRMPNASRPPTRNQMSVENKNWMPITL